MLHFGRGNLTKYHKAIRDKIPEIIEESGHSCNVKPLSDSEFLVELEKKLIEELREYQESKSIEELVDIMEVIQRISELKGTSIEDLENLRKAKAEKRGTFEKNLFLIDSKGNDDFENKRRFMRCYGHPIPKPVIGGICSECGGKSTV